MKHRPMAGNCRVKGAPKTGLDHCPACAAPPVHPCTLEVKWGRVTHVTVDGESQRDDTAFGRNIVPPDGTYVHVDTVKAMLDGRLALWT